MGEVNQLPVRSSPATPVTGYSARNWLAALDRMAGAYSDNTIRCYRADFSEFERWCREVGRIALPASPETVAEFLLAQSISAAPATISRRRAAIAKIHRLLRLENPAHAEEVNLAARSVFREKGRRQEQALGLTAELKQKLITACAPNLRGYRDRALIATGYDTLCRRAELVKLQMSDLTIREDGSGAILVRKSKADQLGRGRLAYLSAMTVTLINRWIDAAGLREGSIFRRIRGRSVGGGMLHSSAVGSIIKQRAKNAHLPQNQISRLSGHSMRVGAAQDMAAAGIELVAIMHAGGWKSPEMVMRYIEHMDVRKSGMARLYSRLPTKEKTNAFEF